MECMFEVDYEPSDACFESVLTAKKTHKCCECGCNINVGNNYEKAVLKDRGKFTSYKTCIPCLENRNRFCCSWYYGQIWDLIKEEFRNMDTDINIGCIDGMSIEAISKFEEFVLNGIYWDE